MNSELWADSLREGELQSEPFVDRKTHTRRIPSIGMPFPVGDQMGFLTPPLQKHVRSLSNPSPCSPEVSMPPASLLFSDHPTPETSPFPSVTDNFVDYTNEFDNLLTLPQKPRDIDPSLLLRRKSILERGRHSTSHFDQLVSSKLPSQGFLHRQDSNEGFLNIVEKFGSSFENYRRRRKDSNCSSSSVAVTPPSSLREQSSHDFSPFVDNQSVDLGLAGFSNLFFSPPANVGEEAEEMICYWNDCHKVFMGQTELVNHISIDHVGNGQREYFCEWKDCPRLGMPFAKKHKINNHIRIHTGERPFVCMFPGCDRKFARQDGLSTHSKTHSSVKPFYCSVAGCRKAYYHSRSLKKHEKSHLGEVNSNSDLPSLNSWDAEDKKMDPNQFHYSNLNYY